LERIRRRAKAELEANAKSLEIAVDSAKARDKTLEITKRLYDSSVQRFEKGLADANEIIVDQNRWLDSEIFAIAGWSGAHSALVRTCHSVGKRIKDCMAQDP
jgi:outer membrane protein TolC